MATQQSDIPLSTLKITLIYVVIATLWIAFTDRILESFISDPRYLSTMQTYKGGIYILLTAVGLFYLIKKHDRQLATKEEEIEELSEKFSLEKELSDMLIKKIPVLINIYDPDLEEFRINEEFEKISGWKNNEINKIDFMEACFPDFDLRKEAAEFMDSPGLGWQEFPLTTKSGEQVPTSWTNIKLTDDTSVGIGIDMTEIKASQAKVRESRKLLRKIFESLEESVLLLEPENWTIVDCNKSTEKIFGYPAGKLIGKSTRQLHVNEAAYKEFNELGREHLDKEGIFKTEFKMKRKNGEVFFSDHTVSLVYNEEGEIDKIVSTIRDINAQKEYQQRMEAQNDFISITLQNLPIGVAVNTISDGETNFINDQFSNIYGWPKEVLKDVDSFFDHVYQDEQYREKMREQVMADLNSGNPEQMSWKGIRVTTQDRTVKYVDNKAIPLYEQNLMISTVVDVTEQKKLEQQLRQSEEKYRHMFKKNPEPMWIFNPENLAFVEVNEAAVKHYGYSEEEFLNMTIADIRPPEDIEPLKKDVEEHTGVASYSENWVHLKKDGSRINVKVSAADVNYNNHTYRLVLINDITRQKKLKEQLRKSKERIQTITNNVPGVVYRYILHPDGTDEFKYISKGAKKIWGYSREKIEANNDLIWNNIHPEDLAEIEQAIQESAESLTEWNLEGRIIKPDGTTRWHKGTAIPHKDEEENIVWDAITIDITDQKRLQNKIIQSIIEGEDRERKRIARELHDGLGQYLVAANMNFQSVKPQIGQLPKKREQQFNTGLSHLSKALSETRTIAHNLMPKAIADYGLIAALENLINDLKTSTDINFEFQHNQNRLDLSPKAEVNIYRIIQEIISNAVRHAQCSNISVSLNRYDEFLRLIIEDDGIGIELTDKHEDQGLGLRSIKTRVNSLDGSLDIESEPGAGIKTTITFSEIDKLTDK
ncbi:sensor histidine kinase [Fodinibius halophilus]|uniref:PAS domain S-box protein n=1 Tax=Fodinibius halophilus TaxID=1736908 RepID=A0A6M1T9M4_9BACT|nr:PAS domain S-box protein [Fodinibius halophilus]NGP87684.1 PAS domain S-box protein [Fodinibius halophilus]